MRQDIDIDNYWRITILYNVWLGKKNTGFTYSNFKTKRSIVGISIATSEEQFFNTLVHEIKHVQSHICRYYNVKEDSESAAYLIGYIAQKIYKTYKSLIT